MIHIAIINASTVLTDAEVSQAIPALQKQVSKHFYPIWGVNARLVLCPKGKPIHKGYWWIAILDNADVANALGYHDLTAEGLPLGKVFAGTDRQFGLSWTVTLSHELLEMLADPRINLAAQIDSHTFFSWEVCDACEEDSLGYQIDGIQVSDFVTPEWFEPGFHPVGTKFDYRGHIKAPLELLPGGYISALEFSRGSWQQIMADKATARAAFKPGSRRSQRQKDKKEWCCSTAHCEMET